MEPNSGRPTVNDYALPPVHMRRKWRVNAGLNQSELASVVGCDRQSISNWENGKTEPRGLQKVAYAAALRDLENMVKGRES